MRYTISQRCFFDAAGLTPPTLENLCLFIANTLADLRPQLARVKVWREALGDACTLEL